MPRVVVAVIIVPASATSEPHHSHRAWFSTPAIRKNGETPATPGLGEVAPVPRRDRETVDRGQLQAASGQFAGGPCSEVPLDDVPQVGRVFESD